MKKGFPRFTVLLVQKICIGLCSFQVSFIDDGQTEDFAETAIVYGVLVLFSCDGQEFVVVQSDDEASQSDKLNSFMPKQFPKSSFERSEQHFSSSYLFNLSIILINDVVQIQKPR